MPTVTIDHAETHLPQLIARALAGEEVIVARGDTPVVRLVPVEPVAEKPALRRLGWLAHTVPPGVDVLADGFWDPLTDEEMGLVEKPWEKDFS